MKNTNIIPAAATVTLPASEYYALIKLAEGLIKERDVQLNDLSITIESEHVLVNRSDVLPYEEEIRARVVELLVKNDDAMELLVENDEYRYKADSSRLSNYYWHGPDLREAYLAFAKAWQQAEFRLEAQAMSQTEAEAEPEANDESNS